MNEIISWTNVNSGFIMAVLTLVYVVATIVICLFNYKSAKATKEQTLESKKQFIDSNRARIVPQIIEIEGEMLCLVFKNIGKDIANKAIISVNDNWLSLLDETKTFPEVSDALKILKKNETFLTVGQELCYGLCCPGNGHDDFRIIGTEKLVIDIKYETFGEVYQEKFVIPLSSYNHMMKQSDYVRLEKKHIKALNEIAKNIKNK